MQGPQPLTLEGSHLLRARQLMVRDRQSLSELQVGLSGDKSGVKSRGNVAMADTLQ